MKIKFNTLDYVLLGLSVLSIISNTVHIVSTGEVATHLGVITWTLSATGWFIYSKMIESKVERLKKAREIDHKEAAIKAVTSAPSELNTYEKGIYEFGFKDGVNYVKKELEKQAS
jgi:hypothetical protein